MVHKQDLLNADDSFWNQLFNKETPEYKDKLECYFPSLPPLETTSINTTSNCAFSHFQNYHITINYVVDPKCILAMAPPNLKFVKALGPIDIVDKSN
jgi:hypothetical protein